MNKKMLSIIDARSRANVAPKAEKKSIFFDCAAFKPKSFPLLIIIRRGFRRFRGKKRIFV